MTPWRSLYAVGGDYAVDPKPTVTADLLGQYVLNQQKIEVRNQLYEFYDGSAPDSTDTAVFETLAVSDDKKGYNSLLLSVGLKVNIFRTVLLTVNGLTPLTDRGLSDDISALGGIDYSF